MRVRPLLLGLLIPLVPTLAAGDPAAVAPPPDYATDPVALSTQKKVAIGAMSAGGAGLIMGTIFGVATISAWTTAESECGSGCSATSNAQTEKNHASTYGTASTVAFVAGSVLMVGGITLWFTAPSKESKAPPSPSVAVQPGWGGLAIRGSF
jgi:hypothetical protein